MSSQPSLPIEQPFSDHELSFIDESPPGMWPENQDSNFGTFRKAICDFFQEVSDQQNLIFAERFVDTAEDFLDEWERMLGVSVNPTGLTEADRRALLKSKLAKGAFTRTMRRGIVESFIAATFGTSTGIGPGGISLPAGGTTLFTDVTSLAAAYEIREFVEEFRYIVQMPSTVVPNTAALVKALKQVTPAHLSFSVYDSLTSYPTDALTTSGDLITDAVRTTNTLGDARPFSDLEFWGDFESSSAGSATGFSALEAFAPSTQFTIVTSPVRVGSKCAKMLTRAGDQFGTSTGERCEVTRTSPNFGTGTVTNQVLYQEFSFRPEGPWHHASGWEIFQQVHSDSRFGQAPIRIQTNGARTHYTLRLVTGNYANTTDATAGTNPSTNVDLQLLPFVENVWMDWRMKIKWTTNTTGYVVVEGKQSTDSVWTQFKVSNVQTLPTITGDPTPGTVYLKYGFYRNKAIDDPAYTGNGGSWNGNNTLYYDGIRIGHNFPEMEYVYTPPAGGDSTVGIWPVRTNLCGNGGFETNTTSWAGQSGSTITRVTTDHVYGTACLQISMPGAASSEGAQFQSTLTNGTIYCLSGWTKGTAGDRFRVYGLDSTSVALGTTTITQDGTWRRIFIVFTANANQASQLRFGRTSTGPLQLAYLDGVQLEVVASVNSSPTPYIHTDGATVTSTAPRVRIPTTKLKMTPTKGFVATMMRIGFSNNASPSANPYVFRWRVDDNNTIGVRYLSGTGQWEARRLSGGSGATATIGNQGFQRGDNVLVIAAWDEDELKLSVDGSPFVSVANTNIPNLSGANFDIGSNQGTDNWISSSIHWQLFGSGNPTDAQAAAWCELGSTDHVPADYAIGDPANIDVFWTAEDLNYNYI